jgi:hypothetical protein
MTRTALKKVAFLRQFPSSPRGQGAGIDLRMGETAIATDLNAGGVSAQFGVVGLNTALRRRPPDLKVLGPTNRSRGKSRPRWARRQKALGLCQGATLRFRGKSS